MLARVDVAELTLHKLGHSNGYVSIDVSLYLAPVR
jgi:hypothetical protein